VLVDDYLPTYDIADAAATVVHAGTDETWDALLEVDLIEVGRSKPLVGMLGALRALPEVAADLLHGERPPKAPKRLRLHDLGEIGPEEGGWVLLGERAGEEIALGLVGKFWRPVILFADVPAERFKSFDEPGFAKHVYSLCVSPLEDGSTLLRAEMRVATTDEHARRWFRRYWTLGVGSGAHVLIAGLIEAARDSAEAAPGAAE
jgi:hypothetical protein